MKIVLLTTFSILIGVNLVCAREKVSGTAISIEDAPFMVHVQYSAFKNASVGLVYNCGGTILSRQYILTAGHCSVDKMDDEYVPHHAENTTIRVGSMFQDKDGEVIEVSEIHVHPGYTPDAPYHDMSILKLSKKINFNKRAKSVSLARPKDKIVAGRDVNLIGWGRDSQKNTDNLYRVRMQIVGYDECVEGWSNFSAEEMEEHEVCALGSDGAQQCKGDSGGPLIDTTTGRQIGVTSFGAQCLENPGDLPGVYTKVQDNLDWIHSVIKGR